LREVRESERSAVVDPYAAEELQRAFLAAADLHHARAHALPFLLLLAKGDEGSVFVEVDYVVHRLQAADDAGKLERV